jgi:hypothetical protein
MSYEKAVAYLLRAGPRYVGAQGRLVIWRPFKPIFFKNLFNIYLVGAERN